MKLLRKLFLPFFVTLTFISGCATSGSAVGGFNLISIEEEKQLGDKVAVEIEKQHKVVNDPEVQNYINRLGQRLLQGVRQVDFPYTFKVVADNNVNAFAAPGGHTYVHTGLIKAADSETELAAVIAHEINHVVARHSTRQMTQQYGYQMLSGLLLGGQGPLAQIAAELAGTAGTRYYSREMEHQADELGVETMYKAGYNPQGMVTFFRKLGADGQREPGKIAQFFSTHPVTADRISNIQEDIAKLPPKSYPPESGEFNRIKSRL